MAQGPSLATFRSRPNTDSSWYVMPMSASSDCTYVDVIGSSSAVGVAFRKSSRIGRLKAVMAHLMNDLRSTFEIEPLVESAVKY